MITSFDNIIRLAIPDMETKYINKRSITDFPAPKSWYFDSDNVIINFPSSGKNEVSCDEQSCSDIFWPETTISITIIDCSCKDDFYRPILLSFMVTQTKIGRPVLIGQGYLYYIYEADLLVNKFHPIYQQCIKAQATDDCYKEYDNNQFNLIPYAKFRLSLIEYFEEISNVPCIDCERTGSHFDVEFLHPSTFDLRPHGNCFYKECTELPLSYLLVDNNVFKTTIISVDDYENELYLDSNWLTDNFNLSDPITHVPYSIHSVVEFEKSALGVYLTFSSSGNQAINRKYYSIDETFLDCPPYSPFVPRQENCVCDSYYSIVIRKPCSDSKCTDLVPGWYIDLSLFDIDLTNLRFAPPIAATLLVISGLLSDYLTKLLPGITVTYDFISDEITVSIDGVPIEVTVFICPCPEGTSWNVDTNQCCP